MSNGNTSAALRIKPAPVYKDEAPPAETSPEGSTITLTGSDLQAFKAVLGHECKVGDKYFVELTATEVSPNAISFSLDNVESDYEEPAAEEAAPAPAAGSKSQAMTYA